MSTGDNLKRAMADKGVGLHELERRSGISITTLRRLIRGDMVGNLHTWDKIARALDASIDELTGRNHG